jgi:hypothetical protein
VIVRFNERALAALGFDGATIAALRHLLRQTGDQLGGPTLPDAIDAIGQDAADGALLAQVVALRKEVAALRLVIDSAGENAELRKRLHAQAVELAFPPLPADWEHPGKLGDKTPNAVTSTALTATGAVKLNPASQLVDLSPTGTGAVRVNPASTGSMDNVTIGATTPRAATVTTLTATTLVSTVATGTPPLSVASSTQVPNLYASRAATADTANTANTSNTANTAAALSSPHTFPADATDLPSVITLANALKAAATSKGL